MIVITGGRGLSGDRGDDDFEKLPEIPGLRTASDKVEKPDHQSGFFQEL